MITHNDGPLNITQYETEYGLLMKKGDSKDPNGIHYFLMYLDTNVHKYLLVGPYKHGDLSDYVSRQGTDMISMRIQYEHRDKINGKGYQRDGFQIIDTYTQKQGERILDLFRSLNIDHLNK